LEAPSRPKVARSKFPHSSERGFEPTAQAADKDFVQAQEHDYGPAWLANLENSKPGFFVTKGTLATFILTNSNILRLVGLAQEALPERPVDQGIPENCAADGEAGKAWDCRCGR
jgi:hypothetical protein